MAFFYKQILFYVNKRFLTLSLPEHNPKSAAFYLKSKEKELKAVTIEELIEKTESSRQKLKINENDIVFICGEIRYPFQFSLGFLINYQNFYIFHI